MTGAALSNLKLRTNHVLRNAIEEFIAHENQRAHKVLKVPTPHSAKIKTTKSVKTPFLHNEGWRLLIARAGCLACANDIFDELRAVARVMLEALVRDAVTYMEHSRRRTVLVDDILRASLRNAYTLGSVPIGSGFLGKALPTRRALLPGNTIDWTKAAEEEVRAEGAASEDSGWGGIGEGVSSEEEEEEEAAVVVEEEEPDGDTDVARNKKRAAAWKKALRMIRMEQRGRSGLVFAFSSVSALLHKIGQDVKGDLSWEANACVVVYHLLEAYVVTLLQDANLSALRGGRVFIMAEDLQLARRIRTEIS